MADDLRKLVIEIGASYVGAKGLSRMDRDFDKILGKQKSLAAAARAQADAQIKEATRSSAALQKINDKIALSNRRMEDMMVRQAWAASRGRIQAYQSVTAAIGRENEKIIAMQKTLEREQIASEQRIAAATVQANRARNVARVGAVAGGVGALGSGLIGAGAVGLGAGILAGRSAMNWQTMVSQNVANSPMTPAERRAFQQLAFRTATRTGARPEDVFYALRLGSEMQLGPQQDRRYLQSALALGLPTGGSAAIAPSLQAIASVAHNFPQYKNNPQAIAKMLLATVQQSAGGVNVQELTSNMPAVLAMAGHIGGKSSLADALGAAAALGQTGLGMPEISTQLINFLKTLQSGTARPNSLTSKTLEALKTQRGINLFPDFSQQGLAQKGLGGVLSDIAGAHLSQKTLFTLFPNMRGTLAALGLTGNQYGNFMKVQPYIQNAPQRNDLAKNMQNYLGLSSTKMHELNQQLHTLAITTGTQLLPEFNKLMKDAIIPGAKELANFTKENRGLITTLIKISPWLIGAGVGLKAVSGALKLIVSFQEAGGILKAVGAALGFVGKEAAVSGELTATGTALKDLGAASTAAAGSRTAGGALGILGLVAALDILGQGLDKLDGNMSKYGLAIGNLPAEKAAERALQRRAALNAGQNPPGTYVGKTQGVYIGPNWSGPPSTVPQGTGRSFGSSFSYVTASTPVTHARDWYARTFGVPASQIYDTDFSSGGMTGKPYEIPGTGQGKPWTFVRYVQDTTPGQENQMIAIWRTPQGHLMAFNHTDPRGINRNGVWTRLLPRDTMRGGQMAGVSMANHLSIDTTPASRRDILVQTGIGRLKYVPAPTGQGRQGHGGGIRGLLVPASEQPFVGAFGRTGLAHHVDPAILAALSTSEGYSNPALGKANQYGYGSMGVQVGKYGYGAKGQIGGAGEMFQYWLNWARSPAGKQSRSDHRDVLAQYGYKNIDSNQAILFEAAGAYANGIYWWTYFPNTTQFGPGYAQKLLTNATKYNQGNFPATYYTGQGPNRTPTGGTGGTTGVDLSKQLTPVQQWTTRVQGDITQYNARMTAFNWPAGTPIGRVQKPAHRQLVAGYYNDAVWAYAHQLIAQIQAGPGPEAEKAQATHAVWVAYRNGTLEQQLFGKVPPGATRPTTPGGWATWYGNRASQLQTRIGAIAADFPGADLTHPSARQRALLGPLLTGPHGLYRTTLEQTLSMDKVIYAGQPTLRALADKAAWDAYRHAMRHPFTYFPATGANQRPTTPMGWSQWYGAQASTRQGEISQLAALFPNADLSHPNARQRAMLLPLLLGTAGHPGYYKDLLRETLSMDRAIYAGQPHHRAIADRAAWGAYHRELRHPFAYFQGTSATGSGITPVQVVGSNKQLGVAEEHLKVAKQQLAEQKKQTHQEQQQIRHLERVINKLVHWINHHGGHVNVANDYSGVAVTGTSGHP